MFLDHTQLDTQTHTHTHTHTHTLVWTPLKVWSTRRRGRYLHRTKQTQGTKIHTLSGIRTSNPTAVYLRRTLPGHRDRPALLSLVAKYCAFRHVSVHILYILLCENEVHSVLGTKRTGNFTLLKQWSNSPTQFLIAVSTVYPFHVRIFLRLFLCFIWLIFRSPTLNVCFFCLLHYYMSCFYLFLYFCWLNFHSFFLCNLHSTVYFFYRCYSI